jgi:pyrroline-5-carboxylate reductase
MSIESKKAEMKTFGVVGVGNMGAALVEGLASNCVSDPAQICVYDVDSKKVKALVDRCGVRSAQGFDDLVSKSEVLILAIKPQLFGEVLPKLALAVANASAVEVVVSIAAGVSLDNIVEFWGDSDLHFVRVMPNVAALIGQGMSAIYGEDSESVDLVVDAFSVLGQTVKLANEDLMHVATAVAGSGPAFVFAFAEALIAGARSEGLSEQIASKMAIQTISGAAKLMSQGLKTPGELREMVSSPQGTTVEGLGALCEANFAGIVESAVAAASNRSREMMKS